ncbi:MAG: Threonine synthase [Anaerolineales bacterium]|nr:Threonine synthase [Anaerolineales bacterium]
MNLARLQCIHCGTDFEPSALLYRCRECGDLLDVVYDFPDTDAEQLKHTWRQRRASLAPADVSGVWRYRELIPFYDDVSNIVTYPEGNTPLLEAPESARYVGLNRLQVKHQGYNPTGSFKDNGMTTGVTQAVAVGARAVACASTGNTSASMGAYAARAGLLGVVLIPEGQVAFGKLSQALDYGALTLQIQGDFDTALRLVTEVAPEIGMYILNSINPFRLEGQKTIAVEMLDQRDWQVPDRVVVPGGNLGNSSSLGKGFEELYELGFIDRMPHLTIIQAEGAAPLYKTVTSDHPDKLVTVHAKTLATAIKIGQPVSWKKAMRAMDWTDGWVTQVSEQEIADAKAVIGRDGIGCEPASATTVAGLRKLLVEGTDEPLDPDEDVVVLLTGHVLKDPDYTVRYHLGELYADYVVETTITEKSDHLRSTYANRPIEVPADRDTIVEVIQQHLSHGS